MIPISDVQKVSKGRVKERAVTSGTQASTFADGSPAAKIVTALLQDAAKAGATVIHIEPQAGGEPSMRYRIDGFLHAAKALPSEALKNVTKRLKKMANVDVRETRLPQHGRFRIVIGEQPYMVRVNMLPVEGGEKLVLHLLEQPGEPHSLEKLGYWGQTLHVLQQAADTPRGLVVVGGPTGSGKTASLYALLGLAAKPGLSAATVEDTVEQYIPGVTHAATAAKTNISYADTLRAVLHQDPNILLVSDVREPDTAAQMLQAALGGRLVLAGMQSNDLAASVAHLTAMRVEPYILAITLRVLANQRLVRRLCPTCREQYTPSAKEFDAICKAGGLVADGAKAHITDLQSIAAAELNVEPATLAGGKLTLWRASEQGCEQCGGRGHKGRIAIAEAIAINQDMQKLILSQASGNAFYDQAVQDGMVPLPLDGLVKTVLGLTSVEEVLRVV